MDVKTISILCLVLPLVYGVEEEELGRTVISNMSALGNIFENRRFGQLECIGSLELLLSTNEVLMITSEQLANHNKRIRKIQPNLGYVRINGNCCWDVYPRRFFRGQKSTLVPGDELELNFEAKSIKVKNC